MINLPNGVSRHPLRSHEFGTHRPSRANCLEMQQCNSKDGGYPSRVNNLALELVLHYSETKEPGLKVNVPSDPKSKLS